MRIPLPRELRTYLLVIAGCLIMGAQAAAARDVEPYEARVVVARAQVRSGPGDNFYPTGALAEGESVDVYREQSNGWLAIRPPRKSFSWVFGRHLRVREDGLGVVEKDEVASRIGSDFSTKRNAVQVKLHKGEVVEILDEEQTGGEAWYKIAPPAGEFRWINSAQVRRGRLLPTAGADSDARQAVATTSASDENDHSLAADESSTEAAGSDSPAAPSESQVAPGDAWRATGGRAASADDIAAPPLASQKANSPAAANVQNDAAPAAEAASPSVAPNGDVPDSLARQLTDIELRLSHMVAGRANHWDTEPLERDAEALLAQAQTPAQRDAVKETLGKLDQFKAIGQRYQQAASGAAMAGQAAITPIPGAAGSVAEGDSRYDAVGILRPVVSKRPGAPQFALVNERGQVISFVTPTPDMNLQPYVGHRVGVVGNRGFIPEFQRAHVTAGRVTPLGERMLR